MRQVAKIFPVLLCLAAPACGSFSDSDPAKADANCVQLTAPLDNTAELAPDGQGGGS